MVFFLRFGVGWIWYEDVSWDGVYVVLGVWCVVVGRGSVFYLRLEIF